MDLQEQAIRKGMAEADIILTTGGTSMGEADLLKVSIRSRHAIDVGMHADSSLCPAAH